jgi:hypothetical protein
MLVLLLLMAAVYLYKIPKVYDSFQQCTVAGHKTSITVLNNLDPDMINKEQLFFAFSCQSTESA